MATMNRVCESCGEGFWQGRGRPAKRCGRCRQGDRYGSAHRATRAATIAQAVGKPCARCHEPIRPGDAVDLDHDDTDPTRYLGWSHRRCNSSAGAARGNQLRAQAYRMLKAAVLGGEALNGTPPPAPPPPPSPRSRRW